MKVYPAGNTVSDLMSAVDTLYKLTIPPSELTVWVSNGGTPPTWSQVYVGDTLVSNTNTSAYHVLHPASP
jgi:hypothetical protein